MSFGSWSKDTEFKCQSIQISHEPKSLYADVDFADIPYDDLFIVIKLVFMLVTNPLLETAIKSPLNG